MADNPFLSHTLYEQKYKLAFDTIKLQLPYLKRETEHFKELYTEVGILYSYLKYNPLLNNVLDYGGQVKLYAHSEHLKELSEQMNDVIKEIDLGLLIERIERIISFLESPEAFSVTFAPVQPLNDAIVFDVKINRMRNNTSELYNNLNFSHKEYTYGGTRIDFSLGLAGSYFNNTPVYDLQVKSLDTGDATVISIAQKSDKLSVPSVIGMATMSFRSTKHLAYGASVGLGIDILNGKIQLSNFYAGPSIVFGKYERLTFTTGATIRNVGQLSSSYKVGDIVKGATDKISNFITDKYKIGVFASLSFNLTKGVKDNIKQLKSVF